MASIREVDPKSKGFAYCMTDYYLNIRARSESKAPFNMWPHEFKFLLTKPVLIYKSIIKADGTIDTMIFPSMNNAQKDALKPLGGYSRTTTLTADAVKKVILRFSPDEQLRAGSKTKYLQLLEELRIKKPISNDELCDAFAEEIYLPLIRPHKDSIPGAVKKHYRELI